MAGENDPEKAFADALVSGLPILDIRMEWPIRLARMPAEELVVDFPFGEGSGHQAALVA